MPEVNQLKWSTLSLLFKFTAYFMHGNDDVESSQEMYFSLNDEASLQSAITVFEALGRVLANNNEICTEEASVQVSQATGVFYEKAFKYADAWMRSDAVYCDQVALPTHWRVERFDANGVYSVVSGGV